jgi:propanol-preferring alcohol dehydrogenase
VIAIDQRAKALELAKGMGADIGLLAANTNAEQIRDATSGMGVQAVLDFVGAKPTIELARRVIRPLGHIVVVGRAGGSIDFGTQGLPYGACISSTYGGSKLELMELLELAEGKQIACHIERHPLSRIDAVFDKLRRNEIVGRAVVVPDGH